MDSCPLRGLIWRRKPKDSFFNGNNEGASTSSIHEEEEEEEEDDEYVRDNNSLLSLQPWVFRKESFGGDTSQASLRNRRLGRFSVKPLGYIEHVGVETFSLSSSPPNSPVAPPASFRPFRVTDGERLISRSRFGSVSWKEDGDGVGLGLDGCVIGMPPLSKSRRSRRKSRDGEHGRLGGCGLPSCFNLSHSKACCYYTQTPIFPAPTTHHPQPPLPHSSPCASKQRHDEAILPGKIVFKKWLATCIISQDSFLMVDDI